MKRKRIGNKLLLHWPVSVNKGASHLSDLEGLYVELIDCFGNSCPIEYEFNGDIVDVTFQGIDQKTLGEYQLVLWAYKGERGQAVIDHCRAFELVSCTAKEGGDSIDNVEIYPETDLESGEITVGIKGEPGKDGITPHIDPETKHWFIDAEDTGILAEGVKGDRGETGPMGPQGPEGPQGEKGEDGKDGVDGKDGSDADVTEENITIALGYKPVSPEELAEAGKVKTVNGIEPDETGNVEVPGCLPAYPTFDPNKKYMLMLVPNDDNTAFDLKWMEVRTSNLSRLITADGSAFRTADNKYFNVKNKS